MDLIHPHSIAEIADVMKAASAAESPVLIVGGRTHIDKGNPSDIQAEVWTSQLDRIIQYDPAEMLIVVEAGMRIGDLNATLAENGQEWPVDAPTDSTVGGVIAAGANSPRRLKVGHVRDTVVEMDLVTGDGRHIRSGARTAKNVTGYDLHRLAVGSLGTLGVIAQVALKLRPLPKARRTLMVPGQMSIGDRLLAEVPGPSAIVATAGGIEVRLEGWPEEIEEQTEATRSVAQGSRSRDDAEFPSVEPWAGSPVIVEAAVPPSRLADLAAVAGNRWGALLGVGLMWVGLEHREGALQDLRSRAEELGGIAPVIRGSGGLGDSEISARTVHRRLKARLDPAGVLAPGRFWGGI